MGASLSVNPDKRSPLHIQIADEVAELIAEGLSYRVIAARLGTSHVTVSKAAKHAGVPPAGRVVEEAVRAHMASARFNQVRNMSEAYEVADLALAMLFDELGRPEPDWAAVKQLNAVWGTATDKGIEYARLFKDAAEVEQRQQTADKLREMTESILRAAEQGVPQPRM
jgi:DNA-binding CsgD family transcriptional regulator